MNNHLMRSRLLRLATAQHRTFGVPRFSTLKNEPERIVMTALRSTLLAEESQELADAWHEYFERHDRESYQHFAKELADVVVIASGTSQIYGLPLVDPKGDPDYPIFCAVSALLENSRRVQIHTDRILLHIQGGDDLFHINNMVEDLGPQIQQLVDQAANTAAVYRIPLMAVIREVYRSNLSKAHPVTGEVLRREDGKVRKDVPWYREPNLDSIFDHPCSEYFDQTSRREVYDIDALDTEVDESYTAA